MYSRTTVNRPKLRHFTSGLVLGLLLLLIMQLQSSAATAQGQFPFVGIINGGEEE